MNSRLDTLQAAILKVKLKAFADYELKAVKGVASQYTTLLQDVVKTPVVPEGYGSSWAQYTIQLPSREQRDALQAALKAQGIPSMVYYPTPMHRQTAFKSLDVRPSLCHSTHLSETVLSLPMHPYLTEEDVRLVADNVIAAIKR